jgi:hypothetical protein
MAYCAMVGAINMARAVSDNELSREILKTVAQRLKNPALWKSDLGIAALTPLLQSLDVELSGMSG